MDIVLSQDLLGEETEAELTGWEVDDGAEVGSGDVVATIETGKAVVEIVAPRAGVLRRKAAGGDLLEPGAVLGSVA
ncbi:lipoyl domain-containing protein [Amycolatopsis sp. H20-H5]|uniref:lipoyl domain-containing protein n=1 Tax=Amycolatopsis sp. H20-H5 TaxID=3046309 RepID=UPI002DBC56D5|nr:lipoyl domain-containing protein [Amycolatopsis sp. H20-H5]MEC3976594.1 lipoyl domain-containing protein [Amycolatopsis sp. H20-H5]